MTKVKKQIFIESIGLIVGCLITSIGINMFFKPNTIAPGGLSGLAVVLNKVTNISVSLLMLLIGVPLVIFAYKILGKKNFIKTMIGTIIFSIFLGVTESLSTIKITHDLLLATIYGSIFVGTGLGIMFRVDVSTGGTDLIALMLSKKFPGIKITKFMMIIDAFVVLSSGIASGNLEIALYSAIALYINVKVIDAIMESFDYSKSFLIISDKSYELKKIITRDLDRGLTVLQGEGGYTERQKKVLFVVVSKNQVIALKKLVHSIDPEAFMMISDVHEVVGKGFKELDD